MASFFYQKVFLELDLVFLFVEEMKFCEMVIRISANANFLFVFPAPMPSAASYAQETSLGEVGMHDGVHRQD